MKYFAVVVLSIDGQIRQKIFLLIKEYMLLAFLTLCD